jgi:hypothetical protein
MQYTYSTYVIEMIDRKVSEAWSQGADAASELLNSLPLDVLYQYREYINNQ